MDLRMSYRKCLGHRTLAVFGVPFISQVSWEAVDCNFISRQRYLYRCVILGQSSIYCKKKTKTKTTNAGTKSIYCISIREKASHQIEKELIRYPAESLFASFAPQDVATFNPPVRSSSCAITTTAFGNLVATIGTHQSTCNSENSENNRDAAHGVAKTDYQNGLFESRKQSTIKGIQGELSRRQLQEFSVSVSWL
ncbi:hypothetical protein OUZ56_020686 [Daphnia magna]|uniref:Uncharacterized protein n=1 Tax=Daphnia magna TaxID=35525 RepID=A0ABQ9ZF57_9CRUS|nr:hypothetical protein OUZ56_020686 [Daphnia magna]